MHWLSSTDSALQLIVFLKAVIMLDFLFVLQVTTRCPTCRWQTTIISESPSHLACTWPSTHNFRSPCSRSQSNVWVSFFLFSVLRWLRNNEVATVPLQPSAPYVAPTLISDFHAYFRSFTCALSPSQQRRVPSPAVHTHVRWSYTHSFSCTAKAMLFLSEFGFSRFVSQRSL